MELIDEIQSLIKLKTEGDYWDFKEMWHSNKASLLHDIICMANNQVGRNAYIIIGVSDSKSPDGVKVKGVPDAGRKDQQHLIDFLRKKKFSGDVRPSVCLQTLEIPDDTGTNQQVDVIIIRDSAKTPYFLIENFRDKDKEIRAGYIYTRIGDTNTAIDSFADLDKIEYLWRKRFGIDVSVNDKLLRLLDEPDDWIGDLNNGDCKYYRLYPEFQIHINDIEDQSQFLNNSIMRNIADNHCDKEFFVSEVVITYHSTILYRENVLFLDGFRYLIPFPSSHTVYMKNSYDRNKNLTYVYLNMESVPGKLFKCFACANKNWYGQKWNLAPGVAFLLFEDNSDKEQFDAFVRGRFQVIEQEYAKALKTKNIIRTVDTEEYFIGGWSKGSEIKAWHLFEQYRGINGSQLLDKLPGTLRTGDDD